MGRGDKRTAKGKRFKGSYGKSRPQRVKATETAAKTDAPKKEKATKAPAKKAAKKAAKKKAE